MKTALLGARAEECACRWLRKRGLKIQDKNWRCSRGEIDLIMLDGKCWVFVEVRYRSSAEFGGALESLTARKKSRLLLAAQTYLATIHATDAEWRVDFIAWQGQQSNPVWIKNALST